MILLIDNYDSFVHNLDRYLRRLGESTRVVRNDQIDAETILSSDYRGIVLSPGPQSPNEAGCCLEVIERCAGKIPILGVCLGHQAIGQAFGGKVVRASRPIHGQASWINHSGVDIFTSLPSPMQVARYHSLVIERDSLPDTLEVLASTDDQIIMAVRHRELPVWGVQFHPESILTQGGYLLLANFLRLAGIAQVKSIPEPEWEHREPTSGEVELAWWECQ